jgi:SAM-dependent methyltransferase
MQHVANRSQAEAWNGAEGEHWAAHGSHAPTEIDRDLLDAAGIGQGDVVLDIGCGTGQSTLAAARMTTTGFVLGVDLSAPQLAEARRTAAEQRLDNAVFEQGDAQVHPLPPEAFDVAISRFGIMFFADPVAAFTNVARALRPDGRLAFVTPQRAADQPWFTEPLAGLLGGEGAGGEADAGVPTPDDGTPGMFSCADPERIVAVLSDAGFVDVRPEPLDTPMDFGPTVDGAVRFYLGSGPVQALLDEHPHLAADARARLEHTMGRYLTSAGVRIPATLWLVTARRP